jgi:hypothetical protein
MCSPLRKGWAVRLWWARCCKKHKNIPHTCTSQSSCMISFFLDPVFGWITSCGTSESLLSYPKLHIQAIEVGSWGSLKAFAEVTNTTWGIEGTSEEHCLSLQNFQKKFRDRIQNIWGVGEAKSKLILLFNLWRQGGKLQAVRNRMLVSLREGGGELGN